MLESLRESRLPSFAIVIGHDGLPILATDVGVGRFSRSLLFRSLDVCSASRGL